MGSWCKLEGLGPDTEEAGNVQQQKWGWRHVERWTLEPNLRPMLLRARIRLSVLQLEQPEWQQQPEQRHLQPVVCLSVHFHFVPLWPSTAKL